MIRFYFIRLKDWWIKKIFDKIPRIAVIGLQIVGKSGVLERLIGIDVLRAVDYVQEPQ